tara:strand:+ start:3053 stop:3631 length:579 start_codon:yes stop_codon:yes gene_type:complete
MPKQIINTKMNIQNIIILSVFIIGCFILYRMISVVQQQVLVLKNEVVNMKLQSEEHVNNTINSFCAVAKNEDDEVVSVNSEQINNIMSKLNGSSDSLESSVVAQDIINSIVVDEPSVNQEDGISENMMKQTSNVEDIDDDIKIIRTPIKQTYDETELSTKQLSELKHILKSISTKPVKGNKNEIIQKILESQ